VRSLALLLLVACTTTSGPQPIAWDREPCAHCRMLISDPHFAAQALDGAGHAWSFDDPGCLFVWLAGHPAPAALWFHARDGERWLPAERAAFVPAQSPMGWGFAVVDASAVASAAAPGALTLSQARQAVEAHASAQP
jgi:copper chaperone NosL